MLTLVFCLRFDYPERQNGSLTHFPASLPLRDEQIADTFHGEIGRLEDAEILSGALISSSSAFEFLPLVQQCGDAAACGNGDAGLRVRVPLSDLQ